MINNINNNNNNAIHDGSTTNQINNNQILNNVQLAASVVSRSSPTALHKNAQMMKRFSSPPLNDYGVGGTGVIERINKNRKDKRNYHSMNETIEVLADQVIEDESLPVSLLSFFNPYSDRIDDHMSIYCVQLL